MADPIATDEIPRLTTPLPWHAGALNQLASAWSRHRFPHALLVHGPQGVGKRQLAAWLSASVLCDVNSTGLARCAECASCKLIAAGSHPDLLWVHPEEDKQQISVDQIRAVSERLQQTSYRQGYKVAVIEPVHQVTAAGANALLKTLEEPPPRSLLLLVSWQPSTLPATVRSRCQQLAIPRPGSAVALDWLRQQQVNVDASVLEFAAGGPLRALACAGASFSSLDQEMQRSLTELLQGEADVTQVAGHWCKESLPDRLVWLDLWLTSNARGALTGNASAITFPTRSAHLPSLPRTANISSVYEMVDRIRSLKAQLARTALQRELAMESWLLSLLDVFNVDFARSTRAAPPAGNW
jgi:DNA polymerase III subunit delta'